MESKHPSQPNPDEVPESERTDDEPNPSGQQPTARCAITAGFGAVALAFGGASLADEPVPYTLGEALMIRYQCATCHAAFDPSKAPSLHAIAGRYATDPAAQQELETMVLNGSAGEWGTDSAMPANDVPAKYLHTLIEWILSMKH